MSTPTPAFDRDLSNTPLTLPKSTTKLFDQTFTPEFLNQQHNYRPSSAASSYADLPGSTKKKNEISKELVNIKPATNDILNPLLSHEKTTDYIGPVPKFQQQTRSTSVHHLDGVKLHSEILRKLNVQNYKNIDDLRTSLGPAGDQTFQTISVENDAIGEGDSEITFPFSKKHIKVEEMISLVHLRAIELKFDQFNDHIDLDNFTEIILQVLDLARPKYEKHIRNLFMKIDTTSRFIIDWNQFLSYMAVELQEKERVQVERNRIRFNLPAIKPMTSNSRNKEENRSNLQYRDICDIVSIRELRDGGFCTANTDGTILVFPRPRAGAPHLSDPRRKILVKKFSNQVSNDKSSKGDDTSSTSKKWVTDMAVMKSKVAVATGDREILIYELFSGELYVTMDGLRRLPVKLEISWVDDRLIIAVGDDLGCISLIDIEGANEVLNIWSNKVEVKKGETKSDGTAIQKQKEIKGVMSLDELVKKFSDVRHHRVQLHDDWITQMQIVPETKEIYTSSNSPNASLVKFCFHSNSYWLGFEAREAKTH